MKCVAGWIGRKSRSAAGVAWVRGWLSGWLWRARWLAHRAVGRWAGWSLLAIGVIVVGAVVALVLKDPDWLTGKGFRMESGSTTIRNVGLVGGGLVAILIAYWRSRLAQQDLLNKRYQEGAAMLGNEVLSVRLAGIYALERLAKDHPWEYHIEVVKSLCAFVRHPGRHEDVAAISDGAEEIAFITPRVREDVQVAMEAILAGRGRFPGAGIYDWILDLHGSDLKGAHLAEANLSDARLQGAQLAKAGLAEANLTGAKLHPVGLDQTDPVYVQMIYAQLIAAGQSPDDLTPVDLTGAQLYGADLTGAELVGANLTNAELSGATLAGANLTCANLSGAKFTMRGAAYVLPDPNGPIKREAIGLTQLQLNLALCDPNNPPKLDGMVDPGTDPPKRLRPPSRGLDGVPHPKRDDGDD